MDDSNKLDAAEQQIGANNDAGQAPGRSSLTGWRLFVVQFILCVGLLLSVMESSIVATALVTIGQDFKDFTRATWIILAYLLSYMGLATIFARLSDVIGRKWAVVLSWVVFTAFSLGCGLAQSLPQLIAFRTLQGVGGSGLYTLTFVTVPEVAPPGLFSLMSGCLGSVFAIAGVLGPVLGGIITHYSTWRWVFLLNCPVGVAAIIIFLLAWPGNVRTTIVKKVEVGHIDWVGAVLVVAASVLLIFGLQQAGSTAVPWSSASTIATLTIAGVCWVLLACWVVYMDKRHAAGKTNAEAIFPLPVVTRGKMPVIIVTTILTGFPFFVILVYLPERFQIVQLDSSVDAGVHLLPLLCASAVGSGISAGLSVKKNNTFWTLTVGSALLVLGCGLLSTAENSLKIPHKEYGYQVIAGLGLGCVLATATVMVIVEARIRDMAVGQGVINQSRIFGGLVGLAISTIIFNGLASNDLTGVLTADELRQLQRAPTSAYSLTLNKQLAVRDVFARSFNTQLRVCTYVSAACFVVSLMAYSRHPPEVLERKEQIEAVLDGRRSE